MQMLHNMRVLQTSRARQFQEYHLGRFEKAFRQQYAPSSCPNLEVRSNVVNTYKYICILFVCFIHFALEGETSLFRLLETTSLME